jgi:RNA polymerase sigma-70 factor (ECF subfamily)
MTVSDSTTGLVMLATRAAEGEASALEELARRLYPSLQKWLQGLIHERHRDVREELVADVAQETWLQIQRKIYQFKGDTEAALLAWCYRVAFATSKNYLKKYVRVQHREEATEEVPEDEAFGPADPRQTLARGEKLEQVRAAVRRIQNEKHRQAIVLFFFEEMSQKEIADMMGATESAVSTWVYRGKKEIEDYLTEMGFQQ